jgi:hypothetical protein
MTRNLVLAGLVALIVPVTSAQAGDRNAVGTVIPFAGPYTPHFPPYNDPYSSYGYYVPYYPPYGGLYGTPTPVNAAPPAAYVQPAQIYGQSFPFQMYGQSAPGQVYGQSAAPLPAPLPIGSPSPGN